MRMVNRKPFERFSVTQTPDHRAEQGETGIYYSPFCDAHVGLYLNSWTNQVAQSLFHHRFLGTLSAAFQPLMKSLRRDRVRYGAANFHLEFCDQSRLAVVLFESSQRERRSFEQAFRFHFNCVPNALSIDEGNNAGRHADGV